MLHPMIVQDARLVQYAQAFSAVFSLPQWKYLVTVLLGLLHCDERRTLSVLLRHIAVRVTIFGLCHFLRSAPWSVEALTAVRRARFYAQVAPLVTAAMPNNVPNVAPASPPAGRSRVPSAPEKSGTVDR